MSSITDVAARAGVSVATVSRALRGLPGVAPATREVVQGAAAELGYVPSPSAAGLPTGRTGTIGVVVPWLGRWFFTAVVEGAQQVFVEHGYDVLLYEIGGEADRRELDTKLLSKRVDALLVMSLPLTAHEVAALGKLHRPVAMVGPAVPGLSGVRIDDVGAGYAATKHLLDLGHCRIGFVGGDPEDHLGFPVAPNRQLGYERALFDAGVMVDRTWPGPPSQRRWRARCGGRPVEALGSAGVRIPGELSVVGVDDHDLSRLFDLTTVAQPVREQGRIAAGLLVAWALSEQPPEIQVVTVPTHLVVRGTTGPPDPGPDDVRT